jgi:hypothetical protein
MQDCIRRNILHKENNPDHQQLRRMRQKEEFLAAGGAGSRWRPKPSPPPQWRLSVQSLEFSGKMAGFQNLPAGFGYKSAGRSFGGGPAGFPKSVNSLIILKLMIFSRKFLTK